MAISLEKSDIQRVMNLPYSTINVIIKRYQTSSTGISASCFGQPKIIPNADKQYIIFLIKRDIFMKIENICKALDNPISADAVAIVLKNSGYAY